jgi:lipopolysaccharide biosynthesis glycosyltransferase
MRRRTRLRDLAIRPIKIDEMRAEGRYRRPTETRDGRLWDTISEAPMSTEFAITRFLAPLLGREDWVLFCDCDFLWLADVAELFALADPRFAIMCVKHDHRPPEATKMDNQLQVRYQRKNWSSLVLWNRRHAANAGLTEDVVNTVPGRDLHRFFWLDDDQIGALPEGWNWLEGHSSPAIDKKAIHYTRGGPWFSHLKGVAHADLWLAEHQHMRRGAGQ